MGFRPSRKKERKQKKSGRLRNTQGKKETQADSILLKKFAISRRWRYRNCLRDMLFGSIPPELLRQHDKRWAHSTAPTCTQLVYSLQSHFLPPASVSPPHTPHSSQPPDDTQCQVYQSSLNQKKRSFATFVTLAGNIWTVSKGSSLPSHLETGIHAPPSPPLASLQHFRHPSPILNADDSD